MMARLAIGTLLCMFTPPLRAAPDRAWQDGYWRPMVIGHDRLVPPVPGQPPAPEPQILLVNCIANPEGPAPPRGVEEATRPCFYVPDRFFAARDGLSAAWQWVSIEDRENTLYLVRRRVGERDANGRLRAGTGPAEVPVTSNAPITIAVECDDLYVRAPSNGEYRFEVIAKIKQRR